MNNSKILTGRYKRYYQNVTPLFKERKVQAYTMVILSLFCMSFFGFFAVRPTLRTIVVLQRQIEDRSIVNVALEEKINNLILAQEEYNRIEQHVPLIYSLLPDKPEFTSLLIKLEQLISGKNASITGMSIDPIVIYGQSGVPAEPVETAETSLNDVLAGEISNTTTPISFSIIFKGGYDDLVQILNELTKLDRIVTINAAELKVGDTSGATATLVISIKSQTYYYPLESQRL